MKTLFIGKNCIRLEKISSTNSYLAELLSEKEIFEGTVVVADAQEQGRGQRGTSWQSEAGKNLTLSILLKPTFLKPEEQFELSKVISLAVLDFVVPLSPNRLSLIAKIKWPNDIYIGNKKIAGILIENSVSGNSISHSIIGIGINVNQKNFSTDLPNPTSLKLEMKTDFDLEKCLEQLCSCVEKRYLQLRPHPQPLSLKRRGEFGSEYLKNLYRFNEWANYNYKGEKLKAKITGVTKIGKLILEKDNGEILECDFKEVEFILPSSSLPAH